MNTVKNLIFSDLDGTLLDHFSYQYIAATKTLEQLEQIYIPVILNTSKTFAEISVIHQSLKLDTPFVTENGAAVYIPVGTFAEQPEDTVVHGDYWVKSFSEPVEYWLGLLSEHMAEFSQYYHGFSDLSIMSLSKITGLSFVEAKAAKERQYGEPIHWIGTETSKQAFVKKLIAHGANVLQGGRFIHVSGHSDKGQALLWLKDQYAKDYKIHFDNAVINTIALGDGENDTAMLEAADIAVQIKSPVHKFPKLRRTSEVFQTKLYGPKGWVEAIQALLAPQLKLAQ